MFDKALKALRSKQGDLSALTNAKIKARYQPSIQLAIEVGSAMHHLPTQAHIHSTRSIYAALVNHCFKSPFSIPRTTMMILGHASLHESLSYSSVRLENGESLRGTLGPFVIE